jgi:hypothetical protein
MCTRSVHPSCLPLMWLQDIRDRPVGFPFEKTGAQSQLVSSGSMGSTDRRPLPNAPGTAQIARSANNRLGAVYSALHGFWMSRNTALNSGGQGSAAAPVRRDAYSVVLFDHTVSVSIANDFTNTPDDLLNKLLAYQSGGGTNFTLAIETAEKLMRQHWSTER